MIINTKAHPNKSVYKKQFEELLNCDKLSFGIVSDVRPDTKDSPLWCDITSLQASIRVGDYPTHYDYSKSSFEVAIHIATTKIEYDEGKEIKKDYDIYFGKNASTKYSIGFDFDFKYNVKPETEFSTSTSEKTSGKLGEENEDIDIVDDNEEYKITMLDSMSGEYLEEVFTKDDVTFGYFYCNKKTGEFEYETTSGSRVEINYYRYTKNERDTIKSINDAINLASSQGYGIKSSINSLNNYIVITGIDTTIGISTNSNSIKIDYSSRIVIKAGSAIMPSGNKVTLANDLIINHKSKSGSVKFIVMSTKFKTASKGVDEFGKEQDKVLYVSNEESCISVEDSFDETKDNICLAVFKPFTSTWNETTEEASSSIIVDSINEKFAFLRPWYSPFDIKHRNLLGTGTKTTSNPHALSFNDIESENTLHNKLLKRGVVLSKPEQRKDTCGELKEYIIRKEGLLFDSDDSIFGSSAYEEVEEYYTGKTHFAYFVMPEIPISIVSIEDLEGNIIDYYEWVEHTSIIKVNIEKSTEIVDFKIKYYSESTLEPYISNEGNGVEIKGIRKNCLILSEGKDVTKIDDMVSFEEVSNIDKNYDVYVDKEGKFVKIPSLEASASLDSTDGEISSLFAKSRLEVILTDIPNKPKIKSPITLRGRGIASEEVEIYQSFGFFTKDSYGRKILSKESMICPNPFIPTVDKELGNDSLVVTCEKSNQKLVDYYTINKTNFKCTGSNDAFKFKNREDHIIYGGVFLDVDVICTENNNEIDKYLEITVYHGEKQVKTSEKTSKILARSRSISIETSHFDGDNTSGDWKIGFGSSGIDVFVKKVTLRISYGVIEPILYSKTKDGYLKLKMDKNKNGTYSINPFYGTPANAYNNDDFKVSVDIVGSSNGENITERVEFDSKFRNQQGLNSKVTENVFDEVNKYAIYETSTTGKVTILAYPVGNINNLCGVFSCNYKNLKVYKLFDIRKVCPNIFYEDKTALKLAPFFISYVSKVLRKERLQKYFEFKNISDNNESIPNIDITSDNSFDVYILNENGKILEKEESTFSFNVSNLPNNYRVKIVSDNSVSLENVSEGDDLKLEITHWNISWTDISDINCSIIAKIPSTWEGCSNVTNMKGAFANCTKLKSIPSLWNGLEKVECMMSTFYGCSSLERIPTDNRPLKNVISLFNCFMGCTNLTIDDFSFEYLYSLKDYYQKDDTNYDEALKYTFSNCKKIRKISSWGSLKNVTKMYHTFDSTDVENIPDSWEGLESIESATGTFLGCSFENIPVSWEGLNNLQYAGNNAGAGSEENDGMFQNCKNLKSLPKYWKGLDKLENSSNMFKGCSSLTSIPSTYEGLKSLDIASEMFCECKGLESIPKTFIGLEKVTDGSRMFYGCENISIIISNFIGLDSISNAEEMFAKCFKLTKISSWEGLGQAPENNQLDYQGMFRDCIGLLSIPNTFEYIFTGKQPNIGGMFENCESLVRGLDSFEDLLGASSVGISALFKNCTSLTKIPDSWSGLSSASYLVEFCSGCIRLEKIPDSWLGLDSVTSIERIFYNCSSVVTGGEQDVESMTNLNNCQEAFYGMTSWKADAEDIYRRLNNLPVEN